MMRLGRKTFIALVVATLTIGLIAEWLHWEVEKPMLNFAKRRELMFPSPFYLWYWPLGCWEDFAITLSIVSLAVLAFLALFCVRGDGRGRCL